MSNAEQRDSSSRAEGKLPNMISKSTGLLPYHIFKTNLFISRFPFHSQDYQTPPERDWSDQARQAIGYARRFDRISRKILIREPIFAALNLREALPPF